MPNIYNNFNNFSHAYWVVFMGNKSTGRHMTPSRVDLHNFAKVSQRV